MPHWAYALQDWLRLSRHSLITSLHLNVDLLPRQQPKQASKALNKMFSKCMKQARDTPYAVIVVNASMSV